MYFLWLIHISFCVLGFRLCPPFRFIHWYVVYQYTTHRTINWDIKNVYMYVGFHDISLINEFPMNTTDVALSVV